MSRRRGQDRFVMVLAGAAFLAGCQSETRVVYQQPGLLDRIPNAKRGGVGGAGELEPAATGAEDVTGVEAPPVTTNADGTVTLVCASVRHVMVHTANFLNGEHTEAFFDQVLASGAKEQYRLRGLDPRGAIDDLRSQRAAIMAMFVRMPAAEQSATVIMEKRDRNTFVVRLVGAAAKNQELTELWVVYERGGWRLLWVAGDGG